DVDTQLTAFLNTMTSGGGTNYEAAFKDAANWFRSPMVESNPGNNLTYFITDGEPTYYYQTSTDNPTVWRYSSQNSYCLNQVMNGKNYEFGDTIVARTDGFNGVNFYNIKDGPVQSGDRVIVDGYGRIHQWTRVGNRWD